MNKREAFIVFEGIDGSGKTTQISRLGDYIRYLDKYQDVLLTREPTYRAEEIRTRLQSDNDAFSDGKRMAELFIEDRRIHVHEQIIPELRQKAFVLCDRYSMSTCAYQSTQGISIDELFNCHLEAGIIAPDLTFYIDVSVEMANQRKVKSRVPLEKFEKDIEFNRKLREQYLLLAQMAEEEGSLAQRVLGDVIVINGNHSKDDVASDISRRFERFYQERKNGK